MEHQLTPQLFLVCKYQHWGSGRLREWIVFGLDGVLGFYRHTQSGHRVLEWQGWWTCSMVNGNISIHLWEFACSPHGAVRRHTLGFHAVNRFVFTSWDENKVRSFFPFIRTDCPRWALFTFVEWLDRFTSGEGPHYDYFVLGDNDEWEVVV